MTLVITLIKPISLSICINFQYFYMQKTVKISWAPPLTPRLRRAFGASPQTPQLRWACGTSVFPLGKKLPRTAPTAVWAALKETLKSECIPNAQQEKWVYPGYTKTQVARAGALLVAWLGARVEQYFRVKSAQGMSPRLVFFKSLWLRIHRAYLLIYFRSLFRIRASAALAQG